MWPQILFIYHMNRKRLTLETEGGDNIQLLNRRLRNNNRAEYIILTLCFAQSLIDSLIEAVHEEKLKWIELSDVWVQILIWASVIIRMIIGVTLTLIVYTNFKFFSTAYEAKIVYLRQGSTAPRASDFDDELAYSLRQVRVVRQMSLIFLTLYLMDLLML